MIAEKTVHLSTFWEVWSRDLPVDVPKTDVIEALSDRWGISKPNVYARLRSGNLKNFIGDISFLYTLCKIGFSQDRGFYFDRAKYDLDRQNAEMESAKMYGLSKSV